MIVENTVSRKSNWIKYGERVGLRYEYCYDGDGNKVVDTCTIYQHAALYLFLFTLGTTIALVMLGSIVFFWGGAFELWPNAVDAGREAAGIFYSIEAIGAVSTIATIGGSIWAFFYYFGKRIFQFAINRIIAPAFGYLWRPIGRMIEKSIDKPHVVKKKSMFRIWMESVHERVCVRVKVVDDE